MDKSPLTKEEAVFYLANLFHEDIESWFTVNHGGWLGCDIVLHMERHFNRNRPISNMVANNPRRSYVFAAAFRAMLEATRPLFTDEGDEAAAARFCKERGWPLCSWGLCGFRAPVDSMVRAADLVPDAKSYVDFYEDATELFRRIMPDFKQEDSRPDPRHEAGLQRIKTLLEILKDEDAASPPESAGEVR